MERLSDSFSDHNPQLIKSHIYFEKEKEKEGLKEAVAGKKPKRKPAAALRP